MSRTPTPGATRLLGALFAALLVAPPVAAVLSARGAFSTARAATLRLEEAARRPHPGADVTLHGIVIGRVDAVTTVGHGASVALRLDQLPATAVVARLLPRTLIGDVYVELVPSSGAFRPGDAIRQDRSHTAVQLQHVIDSALPLLRAIDPAKTTMILTALGSALQGRGPALGETIDRLVRMLPEVAAELPALRSAVRSLVVAADAAADVVPQALAALADLPGAKLTTFIAGARSATDAATDLLERDGSRLVQLAEVSRPTLALLARYSPEYPCLLRGLADARPRLEPIFDGGLHVTFDLVGPRDGYRDGPRYPRTAAPGCAGLPQPTAAGGAGMGYAGTPQEGAVLRPVLAAAMSRGVDDIPDVAGLLVGPLARGTVVAVS